MKAGVVGRNEHGAANFDVNICLKTYQLQITVLFVVVPIEFLTQPTSEMWREVGGVQVAGGSGHTCIFMPFTIYHLKGIYYIIFFIFCM